MTSDCLSLLCYIYTEVYLMISLTVYSIHRLSSTWIVVRSLSFDLNQSFFVAKCGQFTYTTGSECQLMKIFLHLIYTQCDFENQTLWYFFLSKIIRNSGSFFLFFNPKSVVCMSSIFCFFFEKLNEHFWQQRFYLLKKFLEFVFIVTALKWPEMAFNESHKWRMIQIVPV